MVCFPVGKDILKRKIYAYIKTTNISKRKSIYNVYDEDNEDIEGGLEILAMNNYEAVFYYISMYQKWDEYTDIFNDYVECGIHERISFNNATEYWEYYISEFLEEEFDGDDLYACPKFDKDRVHYYSSDDEQKLK